MAGKENTFKGPYQYDLGKGSGPTIAARLESLRDGGQLAYLNPVIGTATSTDIAADYPIGNFTIVTRFKLGALTGTLSLAGQRTTATTGLSWMILETARNFTLRVSSTGTTYTSSASFGALPAGLDVGDVITLAFTCIINNGASGHTISTRLLQSNGTWLDLGTASTTAGVLTLFNSTATEMIGNAAAGTKYDAPIYWMEFRNGTNPDTGPLIWRFNAGDYKSGTTVTTDGRIWTLTSAATLSPKVVGAEAKIEEVAKAQALDRTAANGDKIVGETVYFCRELGVVTQEQLDELVGPAAFPKWPVAGVVGFTLVYEPEWWPVEHGKYPAFQVKRPSYGGSVGGDFVRGSTDPPAVKATISTVAVAAVNIATITTSAAHKLFVDQVVQISGVTPSPSVYNGKFTILSTPTTTTFTYAVISGVLTSTAAGGNARADLVLPRLLNAVLKYPTGPQDRRTATAGQALEALLYVQPAGYNSVKIEWLWPAESGVAQDWKEVSLVRSMFGSPTTVMDGQTIYGPILRTDLEDGDGNLLPSPILYDTNVVTHLDPAGQPMIAGGYWLYYTLFFNLSPKAPELAEWVPGYSDWVQLPQKFGHDEHLWNGIPPYYQFTDNSLKTGQTGGGPLKKFLDIFAFELDFTRQSVEFVQDMYHIDKTPLPLLNEIGRNFDATQEKGVGDIRFRAALANLTERQTYRGTEKGLQKTIETVSKYETDITTGKNMMLLPDDSSAVYSSGNWAGPHPSTVGPLAALAGTTFDTVVAYDKVNMEVKPSDAQSTVVGTQGFLRTTATVTGNILLTCGCGMVTTPVMTLPPGAKNVPGEYIPLLNGIPVDETGTYGFMTYLRNSVATTTIYVVLMWFDASGSAVGIIDTKVGDPLGGTPTTSFGRLHVTGTAPAGAVYLIPALHITGRVSVNNYVDMTGSMVYQLQAAGTVFNVTAPDRLLTLGQINDKIGAPPKPGDPTWPGFVIGAPVDKD